MPSRSSSFRAVTLATLSMFMLVGCAGSTAASPSAETSAAGSAVATLAPSLDPSPAPSEDVAIDTIPTACYGLGLEDCRRVAREAAALLTDAVPAVRYIQVGPCPTTLIARPEGDITFESAGRAVGFHVKAAGGALTMAPQETFGISLPPTTTPPAPGEPRPFTLGHCGLWSGIDLGGSWWDPVGLVDADHGDSINAAEGTIVFVDPEHALFTSKAGLAVRLVRRDGEKYLPLCD
jgi:hypothetical protein